MRNVDVRGRDVLLIGGCHLDVVARPAGRYETGTSCPGRVEMLPGGVARNIAVLLSSAGLSTSLVSAVGDDATGARLEASIRAAGVHPGLFVVAGERTGAYVAVHDQDGELISAVSDLALYDRIDASSLSPLDEVETARLVFADANLQEAALSALAARAGARLVLDAISRAKAPRLRSCLTSGALVFANLPSASALVDDELATPVRAAGALAALGARRAVVTGGRLPVAVLDEGRITAMDVPPVPVADVTGAGDALAAGTIAALARNWPLAEAVGLGIRSAAAAVGVAGALSALPSDVVRALRDTPSGRPSPRVDGGAGWIQR